MRVQRWELPARAGERRILCLHHSRPALILRLASLLLRTRIPLLATPRWAQRPYSTPADLPRSPRYVGFSLNYYLGTTIWELLSGSNGQRTHLSRCRRANDVESIKVTDVWGQFSVFGGLIYFELVATSKAEVGLVCKLEMWSGAKLYETQTVTLRSEDLERGQTLEVSFAIDAEDKIMALVQPEDTRMKDVVDLKYDCLPPSTPTPKHTNPLLGSDRIAFTSRRDGNREIYVTNADGSGQTRLTDNPYSDQDPSWSPDGTKIAFVSERLGAGTDIYVMNADGSDQTRLTDNTVNDLDPSWGPGS